jgi:hypothetical protein
MRRRRLPEWGSSGICLCGCPEIIHRHLRAGEDCGHCGRDVCVEFRDENLPHGLAEQAVVAVVLCYLIAFSWARFVIPGFLLCMWVKYAQWMMEGK